MLLLVVQVFLVNAQDFGYGNEKEPEKETMAAYERNNDAFIGVSGGVALPLGQFKSKDYLNYYSGYAENGYQINLLNAHQKFTRHYGIGVNWTRSQFDYNHRAFTKLYDDFYNQLDFKSSTDGDWILHSVIGSFLITIPHDWFDVDVRVGAGLGRAIRPEILLEGYESTTGYLSYSWKQNQSVVNDVMYSFGMNLRVHVYKSIDFLAQWEYLRMSSTFEIENVYALSFSANDELDQHFEVLTLGAGIGIKIE